MTAAEYKKRQTEKEWSKTVQETAELFGWHAIHFPNTFANPIFPDWLFLRDGVSLYVELKTEKGTLSAGQRKMHATFSAHGIEIHVWRPSDFETAQRMLR